MLRRRRLFENNAGGQPRVLVKYLPGYDYASMGGSFARAGSATYIDANGVVQTAGAGVLRDAHYIGGVRTTLLEGSRTNRLKWSHDGTNAAWIKDGTASCALTATGPDGVANGATAATNVGATPTNDLYQVATGFSGAGVRVEPSVWIQRVTTSGTLRLGDPAVGFANGRWDINFALLGTGWNRITRAHPAVTVVAEFVTDGTSRSGIDFTAASGTFDFNFWGAQVEEATFSSSTIPTTSAVVTRAADALSFPFLPVPQAMTVYVKAVELGTILAGAALWHIGGGGASVNAEGLCMDVVTAKYRIYHDSSDAGTSAQVVTAAPAFGDTCEVRGVVKGVGGTTIGQSVNGGAEVVNSNGSSEPFDAAWSAQLLTLNSYSGGAVPGICAWRAFVAAAGDQTMNTMRKLAGA